MARWASRWPHPARVLDLACGTGRHARWLAAAGHRVTAVDRDALALTELARTPGDIEILQADLETGPWPLEGRLFDAVLVTNYLWRPRLDAVVDAVAPGGWLVYETFAAGQEALGRPSRPDFLLQSGELLERLRDRLRVVAYEEGRLADPLREVQRVAARRDLGQAKPTWTLPGTGRDAPAGTRPDND